MIDYRNFIKAKLGIGKAGRAEVECIPHPNAKPHQAKCLEHLLTVGTGAAFLDTGLGKTFLQLDWARHVPGEVLIIAPLAVSQQTAKEAESLLGMPVHVSRDGSVKERVTIINYERAHMIEPSRFAGVVLDESSILKGQSSKTRQWLTDSFRHTPWKLACTATPSPNDHTELGQHSEFLGIMPMQEMLMRWFIHDSANTAEWRLKGHAEKDFWSWVASWASCVSMPSDLGFDDEGYVLPPLNMHTHTVNTPMQSGADDELFAMPSLTSATDLHRTKRLTLHDRCKLAAELATSTTESCIVWCESNDESALLKKLIPDAVEVKGSDSIDDKEDRMEAFTDGRARVLISKASICGFGMNWQHASMMVFASISYSYESFYQAIRREWRFGQTKPVNVHVVISDAELPVWRTVERKANQHDQMKKAMVKAIMGGQGTSTKNAYDLMILEYEYIEGMIVHFSLHPIFSCSHKYGPISFIDALTWKQVNSVRDVVFIFYPGLCFIVFPFVFLYPLLPFIRS